MFWSELDLPPSPADITGRVQSRLRRLFPSLGVTAKSSDYGQRVVVGFMVDRSDDQHARGGFCVRSDELAGERGCRALAGLILRAAYPRGWAQP